MRRILLTGMSGTGKSSALVQLAARGFAVVDTDEDGWSEWSAADGGYVWREDRIAELLSADGEGALFVAGTVSNQGRFYPDFDAVVLLSAPAEVILSRVAARDTNPYGKSEAERRLILQHLQEVEPLLRRGCTVELDATQPLARIVEALITLAAT